MRRVTVKDIAAKCGVSRAVASAVLGGSKGTIRFSKEVKARVLEAAEELHYVPNRLATAMKSGKIPLVAFCLHIEFFSAAEINLYQHDMLPAAARKLHELDHELIFVPFVTIDEQIHRIKSLVEGGLAGGIVSNFFPGEWEGPVRLLKKLRVPYVMLGAIADDSVPCVLDDARALRRRLVAYASGKGFRRVVTALAAQVANGRREVCLNEEPMQAGGAEQWVGSWGNLIEERAVDFADQDILFVAQGEETLRFLVWEKKVPRNRIVSVENKRVMINSAPSVLCASMVDRKAEAAVEMLSEWIKTGEPPERRRRWITLSETDLELIERWPQKQSENTPRKHSEGG